MYYKCNVSLLLCFFHLIQLFWSAVCTCTFYDQCSILKFIPGLFKSNRMRCTNRHIYLCACAVLQWVQFYLHSYSFRTMNTSKFGQNIVFTELFKWNTFIINKRKYSFSWPKIQFYISKCKKKRLRMQLRFTPGSYAFHSLHKLSICGQHDAANLDI